MSEIIKALKTPPLYLEVEIFNSKGESLGMFDELQFIDLRRQICEKDLEGYYTKFKGEDGEEEIHEIDKDGNLETWNRDIFNTELQLQRVLEWRRIFREKEEFIKGTDDTKENL